MFYVHSTTVRWVGEGSRSGRFLLSVGKGSQSGSLLRWVGEGFRSGRFLLSVGKDSQSGNLSRWVGKLSHKAKTLCLNVSLRMVDC